MAKTNKVSASVAMRERDWEAEDDLRTLQRAMEIKNDPARLKRAQDLAKEKLQEMAQVAGQAAGS